MRLILLALFALVCYVAADPMVLDQRIIDRINSDPKKTWTAGVNPIFAGKRLSQVKHMLGAFLVQSETDHSPVFDSAPKNLPDNFDSYKNWPQCAHPVRNQARCGSCWAFSASEAFTDRACIAQSNPQFPILSPQDMVSCDSSDYGCRGGYLTNAWRYLENTGIVTDQCFPYKSGGGFVPSCPNKCDNSVDQWKKYKVQSGTTKHFGSVESAQNDIMAHGPIQGGFQVFQDFFSYTSGVYQHKSGGLAGGHAILVTGWGVDSQSKLPYWIVKNSWGTGWGMSGFFWILRGSNECDLEKQLFAGQA